MSITDLEPEFEPVRVGIIGVGRHARLVLLPALSLVPELRLVAACTAHNDTADAAAARYRVPTYLGFEEMLELAADELDAVLVVGGQHGPEMLACLDAGLHVWCETPAVNNRETADQVRQAAREAGKIVEVGSCLRHAPIYVRLKQLLEEWRRESEDPRLFHVSYYPYVGHFYNLLLHLNGRVSEVSAVKGLTETLVHLQFENGDLGTLVARHFNNNSVPFEEVAVSGADGLLVARDGRDLRRYRTGESLSGMQLRFDAADAQLVGPTFSMPYGEMNHLYLRGYVPELEHFARRVRQGAPPVSTIDDMEQTVLIGEAVDRAAASRQWEPVEV